MSHPLITIANNITVVINKDKFIFLNGAQERQEEGQE